MSSQKGTSKNFPIRPPVARSGSNNKKVVNDSKKSGKEEKKSTTKTDSMTSRDVAVTVNAHVVVTKDGSTRGLTAVVVEMNWQATGRVLVKMVRLVRLQSCCLNLGMHARRRASYSAQLPMTNRITTHPTHIIFESRLPTTNLASRAALR